MTVETAETHDQILAAALKLVARRGLAALTMNAVAKEAGITRQTVYFYFGSRQNLLSEMMRARMRDHPLVQEIVRISEGPPTIATFEAYVAAGIRFAAALHPISVVEWAHAATDKAALKAMRALTDHSVARAAHLLRRLQRQGLLQPGWTIEDAAEWVVLQLYPGNYLALGAVRGWPVERIIDRTLDILRRSLLKC
jgi:AcrR family transcriptional regulator